MKTSTMKTLMAKANNNASFYELAVTDKERPFISIMLVKHFFDETFGWNCWGKTIKYRYDNPALSKTESEYYKTMEKYVKDYATFTEMYDEAVENGYNKSEYHFYCEIASELL